ncbi:hypothetical protein [Polyangium aurulentum]|uniref:hypothetical protein n=1 Tax=Polyangium aurulentum TaxID=2567896 RepID=UPI0010AE2290|nr:hypothetical protein [Polyangium aurulentum]UQA57852.1 hypothetical protein E8A73_042340 [Polyangium aurulentum]
MPKPDAPHGLTLVEQLRALAGVGENVNSFEILRDGCPIRVVWSPGSTDSLDLYTAMPTPPPGRPEGVRTAAGAYRGPGVVPALVVPRPMAIKLRREDRNDKDLKAAGINREFQTGDPLFDTRVYIDTQSEDEVIRTVLASTDARIAALDLLEKDCSTIIIDNAKGDIHLGIVEFAQRAPDQARAERLVQNMARLARALPAVRTSGTSPVDPTGCPVAGGCVLTVLGLVASPITYFATSPGRCVESDGDGWNLVCGAGPDCCTPGLVGITGGVLLSLPIILLFSRVIRGRSDSSTTRSLAYVAVVGLLVELGVIVARLAW